MYLQNSLFNDQILGRVLANTLGADSFGPHLAGIVTGGSARKTYQKNIPLNVTEHEGELEIQALIPGYSMDELEIEIVDKELSIRAKKAQTENKTTYLKQEFSVKTEAARTVELPYEVNSDKVEAHYRDGLLTIRVPQAESAKPKKVQVKVS